MIKKNLFIVFCLFSVQSIAQISLVQKNPKELFENILVERISGDQTFTSFVIWVKKDVQPHYHKDHAENIYILEGSAKMKLGDKNMDLEPGDYVHIPKGVIHSVTVTSKSPVKVLSIQSPEFKGKDRIFVTN